MCGHLVRQIRIALFARFSASRHSSSMARHLRIRLVLAALAASGHNPRQNLACCGVCSNTFGIMASMVATLVKLKVEA
jgi:hypothetical protein